jgi:hypothetical protein
VPLSKYNKEFGGDAEKAYSAMQRTYGEKKGKQIFYATKNKRKKKQAVKQAIGRRIN